MAQKFLNGIVSTGNILPSSDSTYDLGHGNYRWANLNVDAISTTSTFVAGGTIALNSSISTLNKAQTSYISFATRNTSGSETLMDLSNIGTATFEGNITGVTETLTGATSLMLTLNPTANNYGGIWFKYGGTSKGMSVYNSGSMVYGGESGVGTILQTNGSHALNIDTSQNATFAGGVTVDGTAVFKHGGTTFKTTFAHGNEINTETAAGADATMYLNYRSGTVNIANSALKVNNAGDSTIKGHLIPHADATYDLGTTDSKDFRTLYVRNIDVYNQRLFIETSGTLPRFFDHPTVGDGIQFNHLGTEILRLGNGSSTTATFAGTITTGDNSNDNYISATFSDSTYTRMHGYGLYMSRDNSYIRPTTDTGKTLYIGSSDKRWDNVNVHATNATFAGNVTIAHATNPYIYINDTNAGAGIFQQEGNDTRIGSDTNTTVKIVQNNQDAITINTSKNATFAGNLGTGGLTATDVTGLSIKSQSISSQQSAIDIIQNGSGTNPIIRMGEKSTNGARLHMFDSNVEKIAFYTDGTDNHITAGKLGLGTSSPQDKLHVYGTVRGDLKLEGNYTGGTTDVGKFSYAYAPRGGDSNNKNIAYISGYNTTTDSTSGGYIQIATRPTNGTMQARIRIDQDGEVGINTTNPTERLEVVGNILAKDSGVLAGVGGAKDGFIFHDLYTGSGDYYGYKAYTNNSNTRLSVVTNGDERLTVLADGKVGVGIETLHQKFSVNGNINITGGDGSFLTFNNGDANISIHNNNADSVVGRDLSFKTYKAGVGNTEKMRINRDGNVGIGLSNPSSKLHVRTSTNFNYEFEEVSSKLRFSALNDARDANVPLEFAASSFGFLTGNTTFAGSVKVKNALIDNASVTSATTTTTVASVSGTTYAAVFFDYVIYKSSNIRAGTVVACSDGTTVSFTETSTTDLGDTSDVTLAVDLSSSNFRLRATTASSTWNIKALTRAI
jgi:hypothetical protein